jgi:hypothetical protein
LPFLTCIDGWIGVLTAMYYVLYTTKYSIEIVSVIGV